MRGRIARKLQAVVVNPARYLTRLSSVDAYKLRVGDYRVVFEVVADEVWILTILNRSTVYEQVTARTPPWRPGTV